MTYDGERSYGRLGRIKVLTEKLRDFGDFWQRVKFGNVDSLAS